MENQNNAHLKLSREKTADLILSFDSKFEPVCLAYNLVIEEVLAKEQFSFAHQIGVDISGRSTPGYHSWAIKGNVAFEKVERLLPEIEDKARTLLRSYQGNQIKNSS